MACRADRIPSRDDAFADLTSLHLATRPFAARLAGGFRYAPVAVPTRGTADPAAIDVRLAAARLEKRLTQDRRPATLADFAAGALMTGRTAEAIAALTEASLVSPADGRILSDLAAAYLVRSSAAGTGPDEDQVRALDAACAAVANEPLLAEAWFNRALAMDGILPRAAVDRAWQDYLRIDTGTRWSDEARDHVRPALPATALDVRTVPLDDVPAAVRANRQRAREAVLEDLAPAWATAVAAHHPAAAADTATRIATVGDVLATEAHDPFTQRVAASLRSPANRTDTAHLFLVYAQARRDYLAERRDEAERGFRRLYSQVAPDNPLRTWTGVQLATIAIDRRDIDRARRLLAEPERLARQAGFRAAHARVLWLRGLVEHQSNHIDAALDDYEKASATFAAMGERENELAVYTAAADNLRLRGERRRSWTYVLTVLARADDLSTPLRRYLAFFNASLFAADEGWLRASLVFEDSAVHEAADTPSVGPMVEAQTTKARLQLRMGDEAAATASLDAAATALARFGRDDYASASLDAVIGERNVQTHPAAAEAPLTRAITFFQRAEPAQVARLLLLRGRARLHAGDREGAEADFRAGLADVERRRRTIGSRQLRVAYLDDTSDLFTEMAELQLSLKHDSDAAFEVVEGGRARTLADATHAPLLSIGLLQRALPAGIVLLEYKVLRTSIVCWIVTTAGHRSISIETSPESLGTSIEQFRVAIQDGRTEDISRDARALYAQLLGPFEAEIGKGAVLAIVPDGTLTRLPFSALMSPSRRFVVQDHAVVMMPSAATFVAASRRAAETSAFRTALIVGAPDVDGSAFPGLAPLPGARAEAQSLLAVYPQPRSMTGVDATRRAFLAALPAADVVHFAGHAVTNGDDPDLSALVLAPAPGDPNRGALRGSDIAQLRLPRTRLVVLAACDTADGPVTRGEGVHNLARPFLDAGVPNVVATLWKIDDALAGDVFRRLHSRVARGEPVADALRGAQLDQLAGGGRDAEPRVWASVVLFGSHRSTTTADADDKKERK